LVAQSYNFTFTSTDPANGDTASGWLQTGAPAPVGGDGYDVIAGSITLDSTAYGSQTLSLFPGSGLSQSGQFTYDNILYPLGDGPGGYLTSENYGLLFEDGVDAVEINLWSNQPDGTSWGLYNTYGLWDETTGDGFGPTEDAGTFTLTAVPAGGAAELGISAPEGGASPLYLLLAGAACAGAMFFSRNRFANLASA
jgi:hypothetical protein